MTFAVRLAAMTAGFALCIAAGAAVAATKSPAMQACSDQWSQLKADDKVPAGQTWPKFWSQCAKDYAAAHPADAAAAAETTAAAPAEPPPAKKAKAAAPAATPPPAEDAAASGKGKSPAMQACSDQWSQLKADDKVPAGQTWPKFWSQCSKDYAAAHPDTAAPAKPAKAAKVDDEELGAPLPDPEAAAKIDPAKPLAGKKEPTPGQKAAWARMRACGSDWQAQKAAGKLPAGAKWPQFWSDCNKRLKAKGQ
ncbi:MAG TPA: hypothetical protein VNX29_12860 [Kaistia sp.]|nr:hypothetical protein [Kaistia sp.]